MKKLKLSITIISLIMIILLILISILNKKSIKDQEINNIEEEIFYGSDETERPHIENPDIQDTDYFLVKNCMDKFLNNSSEEDNKQYEIYPSDLKILNYDNMSTAYKVCYFIKSLNNNKISNVYFILFTSSSNSTFLLEQISEKEYNDLNKVELKNLDENSDYKCESPTISNIILCKEFIDIYKFYTLNYPEYIYGRMTDEYKDKRFGSLQNFKDYIKANIEEIEKIQADKYLLDQSNDINQYIIKDQFENLYIFDEKNPINFNIRLDTYTLEEEKFNKEYDNVDLNQKSKMNINKFFEMINRFDYSTSYKLLSESFREKNMKTEEEYSKIIKSNIFKYNKIEFIDYNYIGESTSVYTLKVTDLTEESSNIKYMTITIKILENRKFIIAFSFK